MNVPERFSLVTPLPEGALASGPFVVEAVIDGVPMHDLGFDLLQADGAGVSWNGFDRTHIVRPANEPVLNGSTIEFTDPDGSAWRLRPLALGDGTLAGYAETVIPRDEVELEQAIKSLAEYLYLGYQGKLDITGSVSEDNVYVTRDSDGAPLALVKMSASHPTLLRQDGSWRQLTEDEDDLMGDSDMPVREDAVTAWDSGNLQDLERLLLDDRFSPSDVTSVWLEVGSADELERLLIERSRGRTYERTRDGSWKSAEPDPDAATLNVKWGAIGAWDAGELRRVAQAGDYDVNGDAA